MPLTNDVLELGQLAGMSAWESAAAESSWSRAAGVGVGYSVVIKFWIFKLAESCGGAWLLRAGFKEKKEAGSFFSVPRRDARA